MKYVRVFADSMGETHFEDVEVALTLVSFAPPASPLNASAFSPASHYGFVSAPPGWHGDWHPAPRRQFMFYLSGELEVEVSDGEVRCFGPGSVSQLEDTTGRGHAARAVSSHEVLIAVVQLDD